MYSVPRPTASRLFHVDQWMPCTHEDGPQVIWNRDDRSIQQTTILPSCMHGSTTTVCRVGALTVTAAGRTLADAAGAAAMPTPAASASPVSPAVMFLLILMFLINLSCGARSDQALGGIDRVRSVECLCFSSSGIYGGYGDFN
jgi:hypothetical protein